MRRGAVAGGTFYCAKKWGGNCSPCPPFTDAPANTFPRIIKYRNCCWILRNICYDIFSVFFYLLKTEKTNLLFDQYLFFSSVLRRWKKNIYKYSTSISIFNNPSNWQNVHISKIKRFKKLIATSKKALTLLYIIVHTRLHSKTINVHRCKGLLLLFKASKFQAAWVDLKQMKVRSSETNRAVPPLDGASNAAPYTNSLLALSMCLDQSLCLVKIHQSELSRTMRWTGALHINVIGNLG